MIQLDRSEPDEQRRTPSDERDHDLRNALSVARLQLDVVRRRLQRGPYNGADLDGALDRVRGSIDRALEVLIDREGGRAEPARADGSRRRFDD